jgi:oligoendopeptidase F
LTWENWFKKLRSTGSIEKSDPDHYINCLLEKLGLKSRRDNIKFRYKKDGISGMAFGISIPGDIRVLLKPVTSPMTCKVLFHECGHGINYASNHEQGIYTIYTTSFDEIMATLFETIGIDICMNQAETKIAKEIKFLEAIRCSISFLFEMEIWEKPEKAEELFREYQLKLPMKPTNKEMWAIDSFRYIDAVYIHNYVLGELYSQELFQKLKTGYGDNYKEWARTINNYFLKSGMKSSF